MLVFFSYLIITPAFPQWKKVKEKEGITVWVKDSSEINASAFLAKTIIKSDVQSILEVLLDVGKYPEWLERCKKSTVLDSASKDDKTIYMRVGVPWPFSDRDMVQQLIVADRNEYGALKMINKPELIPAKKGLVRLQNTGGFWELKKQEEGTEVSFIFWLDPGGLVPPVLANIFLVNGPYKNLKNLKKQLILNDN